MKHNIHQILTEHFPPLLTEITDPPQELYYRGNIKPLYDADTKILTVVGSRKCTSYGRDVLDYLVSGLRGHNITIVSGLALGTDGNAHKAALEAGLHTVAVPGSGIDDSVIYPRSHARLAKDILASGGALLSEYEPTMRAALWTFPQRNRIMVGLSHAVLLIEAAERSGTLITARLTTDYNRDLLAVPGSIFAQSSKGVHQFLKLGARPVTTPEDILDALGIASHNSLDASRDIDDDDIHKHDSSFSDNEREVLALLANPMPRDELIARLSFPVTQANILISKLELDDVIIEKYGTLRRT